MDRACLQEIADTGTTDRVWLARDLADKGLIVPACHGQPGHVCTRSACDRYWRWELTTAGRNTIPGQMEIPL